MRQLQGKRTARTKTVKGFPTVNVGITKIFSKAGVGRGAWKGLPTICPWWFVARNNYPGDRLMPSSRAIDTQVSIPLIGYNAGLGWRRIPNRLQVPSLKVFPQMWWNKKLFSSRKTSNIRGLNLPQILATVTRKEKNLEGRLISRGDKHLSWRKGSEEKHAFRWVEKSKAICR